MSVAEAASLQVQGASSGADASSSKEDVVVKVEMISDINSS